MLQHLLKVITWWDECFCTQAVTPIGPDCFSPLPTTTPPSNSTFILHYSIVWWSWWFMCAFLKPQRCPITRRWSHSPWRLTHKRGFYESFSLSLLWKCISLNVSVVVVQKKMMVPTLTCRQGSAAASGCNHKRRYSVFSAFSRPDLKLAAYQEHCALDQKRKWTNHALFIGAPGLESIAGS